MSISSSYLAYVDCYDAMDKALADPNGARVEGKDMNAATFFRMRCHQARKIDRRRNMDTYEPGDPLYGVSVYDKLVIRIKVIGLRTWVYFTPVIQESNEAEGLSGIEEEIHESQ